MNESARSENASPEQSYSQKLLTEGVLLGAATAFSYAIAFVYERAYALHFQIPVRLVSVTLAGGGVVAFRLFLLSFVGLTLYRLAVSSTESERAKSYGLRRIAIVAAWTLFMSFVHEFEWRMVAGLFAGLAFIALVHFGLPLLSKGPKRPYLERLAESEVLVSQLPNPVVPFEFLGPALGRYALLLFYLLYVAHAAGGSDAKNQREFFVDSSDRSLVVLQIYDSRIVFGRLVGDAGVELGPDISVTALTETSSLRLSRRVLGPLTSAAAPLVSASEARDLSLGEAVTLIDGGT